MTRSLRLPSALLCFLLVAAAMHGQTVEARSTARHAGAVSAHLALGTTNGARAGLRYHLSSSLSAELSFGYVRFTVLRTGTVQELSQDASAASAGVNLHTHAGNDISPFFSFIVTQAWATKRLNEFVTQRRFSLTATTGAELDVLPRLSCFFRVGPSVHFLSRSESRRGQVHVHFDAGLGWTF
ncbi:MAG: hypothetical protein HY962_07295 [Ignavibacteriae bacterium]|nr:hypothetical protein [Ignavibacteriota bacterium]